MGGSAGVILRILRGRAACDDVPRLLDAVRTDIDDWAAIDAGLLTALPGTRAIGDGVEFLLVSTWRDPESVLARGGEITLPRGRVGSSGLLRDGRAGHYELVMSMTNNTSPTSELIRLSSVVLVPRYSSGFYERVRGIWNELVGDAGLVAIHVGRRFDADHEEATIVSVWDSSQSLDAATSGGFVGGEGMHTYYASEPEIGHFTGLALEPRA
jgi:hypothetical protein